MGKRPNLFRNENSNLLLQITEPMPFSHWSKTNAYIALGGIPNHEILKNRYFHSRILFAQIWTDRCPGTAVSATTPHDTDGVYFMIILDHKRRERKIACWLPRI